MVRELQWSSLKKVSNHRRAREMQLHGKFTPTPLNRSFWVNSSPLIS
jgi:hypothetical protein